MSTPRLALLLAVLALSGCGRRGDLEAPSGAAVQTPQGRKEMSVHRANPKITPPKKDFVLDPLLQ